MSFRDAFRRGTAGCCVLVLLLTMSNKFARAEEAAATFAPMPVAASSFGAVACDGWLYVYGGHISRVHTYSTEAVSGKLWRLNLADGKTWEELAGGPGLQGMNLATSNGKVYRVGGMEPRNKPGDPTDNHSVAECSCFDPATGKWTALPPLPQARSSHDVAIVDGKLYVVGGWSMHGDDGEDWLNKALVLDLQAAQPAWQEIAQPFERRALIAAVHQGKVYVIGGFNENNEPMRTVNIYDPATKEWTTGPDLPGKDHNGFAPAACTLNDALYVSVADGSLLRLNEVAKSWDEVSKLEQRIVHRLVPWKSQILLVGGARGMENLSSIEVVPVDATKSAAKVERVTRSPAAKGAE